MKKSWIGYLMILIFLSSAIFPIALADADSRLTGRLSLAHTLLPEEMDAIIATFRQLYPRVEVTVQTPEKGQRHNDFYLKLATEWMSGTGPDVLIMAQSAGTVLDLDKMVASGVFTDLSSFIQSDRRFEEGLYNEKVMSGGRYGDAQYFIPINYTIPVYLTTQETLDLIGETPETLTTYTEIISAFLRLYDVENSGFEVIAYPTTDILATFFEADPFALDAMTRTVMMDQDAWKTALAWYKAAVYPYKDVAQTLDAEKALLDGKIAVFKRDTMSNTKRLLLARYLYNDGKTPVIIPATDKDGNLYAIIGDAVAVRRNSSNAEAAYAFIQVLLDPTVQASMDLYTTNRSYAMVIDTVADAIIDAGEYHLDAADMSFTHMDTIMRNYDKGLPAAFIEAYKNLRYQLSGARPQPAGVLSRYIREAATPYLEGDATFEEVWLPILERLELYISE